MRPSEWRRSWKKTGSVIGTDKCNVRCSSGGAGKFLAVERFETSENRVYRENPTSALAAALIAIAHVQPSSFIFGELTWFPITLRSLVRRTTMMTSGGANKPL